MLNFPEKTPQRGQYVSMQGGETPAQQAEIFQLKVDAVTPIEVGQYQQSLTALENEFPELNSGLISQAWFSLAKIEEMGLMTESAQTVRAAFGEVEANDRSYLPLVTVYFALLHNSLEAQWREKEQYHLLLDWIRQVEVLIEEKTRELEQALITKEAELAEDKKSRQDYQRGLVTSYAAAETEGQKGFWQHTQVIVREDQELAATKDEMNQLREVEITLSNFRYLIASTINQPLETNLN